MQNNNEVEELAKDLRACGFIEMHGEKIVAKKLIEQLGYRKHQPASEAEDPWVGANSFDEVKDNISKELSGYQTETLKHGGLVPLDEQEVYLCLSSQYDDTLKESSYEPSLKDMAKRICQRFGTKADMGIENIRDLVKVQSSKGNYDYDEYMRGLANGLICALATLEGKEPIYHNDHILAKKLPTEAEWEEVLWRSEEDYAIKEPPMSKLRWLAKSIRVMLKGDK